jgi:hypothetical protein
MFLVHATKREDIGISKKDSIVNDLFRALYSSLYLLLIYRLKNQQIVALVPGNKIYNIRSPIIL